MATNNTSATIGGGNSIFFVFSPLPTCGTNILQMCGLVQPPTRQQRFFPGIGSQQEIQRSQSSPSNPMIWGLGVYGASPNLVGAPKVLLLMEKRQKTPGMSSVNAGSFNSSLTLEQDKNITRTCRGAHWIAKWWHCTFFEELHSKMWKIVPQELWCWDVGSCCNGICRCSCSGSSTV